MAWYGMAGLGTVWLGTAGLKKIQTMKNGQNEYAYGKKSGEAGWGWAGSGGARCGLARRGKGN